MQPDKFRVPYGKSTIEFNIPASARTTVVGSRLAEPLPDPQKAVVKALAHPIGSPPLREIARAGNRVCIVFTDITRSSPDHLLVPALLDELRIAGVREDDVTLLCGIGMHRPSTYEEKVAKTGRRGRRSLSCH